MVRWMEDAERASSEALGKPDGVLNEVFDTNDVIVDCHLLKNG